MISFGSLNVSNIYSGEQTITALYRGNDLIYKKNKSPLPSGYIELLSISSTNTQYINTNIPANTLGRIVTKFKVLNIKNYNWAMGSSGSTSGARVNTLGIGLSTLENNNGFCYSTMYRYSFSSGITYDIDYSFSSGEQNIIVNGTEINTNYSGTINNGKFYLFALGYYNNVKTSEISSIELFRTKLYGEDKVTLLRDYVPCVNEHGEAGLYDLVTSTFYGNNGNGSFEKGIPVNAKKYNIYCDDERITVVSEAYAGSDIILNSNLTTKSVSAFKLNGNRIEGNAFVMPKGNVTITDVELIDMIIVETSHPYTENNVHEILLEINDDTIKRCEITVTYATEGISWDYVQFEWGDSNTRKFGGGQNSTTTENLITEGGKLRVIWHTDSSSTGYYGFKAMITPIY